MRATKVIMISLSAALLDKTQRLARQEDRSRGELIREALRQCLRLAAPTERTMDCAWPGRVDIGIFHRGIRINMNSHDFGTMNTIEMVFTKTAMKCAHSTLLGWINRWKI